jgi:uncharacterized protein HemX
MRTRNVIASPILAILLLGIGVTVFAADKEQVQAQDQIQRQAQTQDQDRTRDRDQIYGSQLMTSQERSEHRANMRNMKTKQEREAYRLEHHKKMQERAREQNMNLPDAPQNNKATGMGPGGGMGPSGGGTRGGGR